MISEREAVPTTAIGYFYKIYTQQVTTARLSPTLSVYKTYTQQVTTARLSPTLSIF